MVRLRIMWKTGYRRMWNKQQDTGIMEFRDKEYDVFRMLDKQWALATAGTLDDYDGCTIGWGSLGYKAEAGPPTRSRF